MYEVWTPEDHSLSDPWFAPVWAGRKLLSRVCLKLFLLQYTSRGPQCVKEHWVQRLVTWLRIHIQQIDLLRVSKEIACCVCGSRSDRSKMWTIWWDRMGGCALSCSYCSVQPLPASWEPVGRDVHRTMSKKFSTNFLVEPMDKINDLKLSCFYCSLSHNLVGEINLEMCLRLNPSRTYQPKFPMKPKERMQVAWL